MEVGFNGKTPIRSSMSHPVLWLFVSRPQNSVTFLYPITKDDTSMNSSTAVSVGWPRC